MRARSPSRVSCNFTSRESLPGTRSIRRSRSSLSARRTAPLWLKPRAQASLPTVSPGFAPSVTMAAAVSPVTSSVSSMASRMLSASTIDSAPSMFASLSISLLKCDPNSFQGESGLVIEANHRHMTNVCVIHNLCFGGSVMLIEAPRSPGRYGRCRGRPSRSRGTGWPWRRPRCWRDVPAALAEAGWIARTAAVDSTAHRWSIAATVTNRSLSAQRVTGRLPSSTSTVEKSAQSRRAGVIGCRGRPRRRRSPSRPGDPPRSPG